MDRNVLGLLAEVLAYPGSGLVGAARRCAAMLSAERPGAAGALNRFAAWAALAGTAAAEESYTAAFDFEPPAAPYVGHQLFGEGPERALVLVRLRELARDTGLVPGRELPDHVAEVLKLLAAMEDGPERDELARDGLAPALERMAAALGSRKHPYCDAVEAAREVAGALGSAIPRGEEALP